MATAADIKVVTVGVSGPAGAGVGSHEAVGNAVGHIRIIANAAARPTGLGASEEGVLVYELDTGLIFLWTGAAWVEWNNSTINKFHGVHVNRSTNQSIPDAADTAISFTDADTYDTDAFHDTVTNPTRITVPSGLGGYYAGVAQFTFPGTSIIKVFWRLNGTTSVGLMQGSEGTNVNARQSTLAPISLVAGDYLEVLVYQDTAGAQNVTGQAKLWRVGS